jgi:carboxylesterase type B
MLKLFFVIVVVRGNCAFSVDKTDPVVCLEKGCVRGKIFEGHLKQFEGFLGIPYAQPPINELRLKVSLKNQRCTTKRKQTLFMQIYASRVKLMKVSFNKGSSAD